MRKKKVNRMSDMSRNMEGREAEEILNSILEDYELDRTIDKMEDFYDQPNKEVIIDIIEKLLKIIIRGITETVHTKAIMPIIIYRH
mgnify:CR=1 FL=1